MVQRGRYSRSVDPLRHGQCQCRDALQRVDVCSLCLSFHQYCSEGGAYIHAGEVTKIVITDVCILV